MIVRFLLKKWWIIFMALFLFLITPITVAALTNTEVVSILTTTTTSMVNALVATLDQIRKAGQDAYCASGIAAFC